MIIDDKTRKRFYSHIIRVNNHLLWTGPIDAGGNPVFHLSSAAKHVPATQVHYEDRLGPLPEKKRLLHRCEYKLCISLRHLYLGGNKHLQLRPQPPRPTKIVLPTALLYHVGRLTWWVKMHETQQSYAVNIEYWSCDCGGNRAKPCWHIQVVRLASRPQPQPPRSFRLGW